MYKKLPDSCRSPELSSCLWFRFRFLFRENDWHRFLYWQVRLWRSGRSGTPGRDRFSLRFRHTFCSSCRSNCCSSCHNILGSCFQLIPLFLFLLQLLLLGSLELELQVSACLGQWSEISLHSPILLYVGIAEMILELKRKRGYFWFISDCKASLCWISLYLTGKNPSLGSNS